MENPSILDPRPHILVRRMSFTGSLEVPFNISTYDLSSVRAAKWSVEVFNELPNEQVFRPNTRFVTNDGLVFRSSEWITIPPMMTDASGSVVIGKAKAMLTADGYDTKGEIMGVRGNIKTDAILEIPGLKFNRDKIYAKVTGDFLGWQNPTVHVLSEEEYKKFQNILIDRLKTTTLEWLKWELSNQNTQWDRSFEILDIPNAITYSEPIIEIMNGVKIGEKIPEVKLRWFIQVSALTYDRTATLAILKNLLNEKRLYGTERLHEVLNDSLKITSIVSRNDDSAFSLKATTELSWTISYNFEDSGNTLTKKLKNLIAGLSVEEARSILLNNNNIANVKISLSPFWLTHVSSSPDNIEFVIEK